MLAKKDNKEQRHTLTKGTRRHCCRRVSQVYVYLLQTEDEMKWLAYVRRLKVWCNEDEDNMKMQEFF